MTHWTLVHLPSQHRRAVYRHPVVSTRLIIETHLSLPAAALPHIVFPRSNTVRPRSPVIELPQLTHDLNLSMANETVCSSSLAAIFHSPLVLSIIRQILSFCHCIPRRTRPPSTSSSHSRDPSRPSLHLPSSGP